MTIALAIQTSEGVVCVTDSMRADWSTPWPRVDLEGRKFTRFGERIYAIASGCFRAGIESEQAEVDDVDEVVGGFWPVLLQLGLQPHETHDGRDYPVALLVAGGPRGRVPIVKLLRSHCEPQLGPGAVLAGGAISDWGAEHRLEQLPAPANLVQASDLSEQLCREFLLESYRGWGIEHLLDPDELRKEFTRPGGAIPPCAFPLHFAAITANDVSEWEVLR